MQVGMQQQGEEKGRCQGWPQVCRPYCAVWSHLSGPAAMAGITMDDRF
eukprot:SAG25_NODE_5007_length_715_cov_1.478896_1_plen_47_part_10